MNRTRRFQRGGLLALGLSLATLTGCQTYVPGTGQTLPSPHYLDHPPQYIPPSPLYPLQREQAAMEAQAGVPIPGAGGLVPPR